nr:MAG TPA: hypothetical protein [Caudoviricetes sp.]
MESSFVLVAPLRLGRILGIMVKRSSSLLMLFVSGLPNLKSFSKFPMPLSGSIPGIPIQSLMRLFILSERW